MPPSKKPVDELRASAAPRDLIEWVRGLPPESAAQSAWADASRADWMPYLAALRGITQDAILRATCECALDTFGAVEGPEAARLLDVLRATVASGRSALATVETDLADLKRTIISWSHASQPGSQPGPQPPPARPPWMSAADLVFELARATSRGSILVGIALAMKMLAQVNSRGRASGRPAHTNLVARFRDKLVVA